MKKITSFFLVAMLAMVAQVALAAMPTISTDGNEVWYFLKFVNGDYVVASNGAGATCKSASPNATRGSQLWKVEGSEGAGYTFTNKLGLTLTYTGTAQGDNVQAANAPTANNLFAITPKGNNFTISPKSNTGQALNCWGGMGSGNDIRLYASGDANAPMEFVSEDEYKVTSQLPIIPYPSKLTRGEGTLALSALAGYNCTVNNDSVKGLLTQFASDLAKASGISLSQASGSKVLQFVADPTLGHEAYKLDITADGITVTASDYAGFLYGLTTIRQLLPREIFTGKSNTSADWTLPVVAIEDKPDMAVRGFMLDCARHFFTIDEVKKLIDVASVYKLNRFHWHLTDDQGWRIEIPEFPKLTEVGAIRKRSATLLAGISNFFDDTEYGRGCYYTLDQLRDVVAYAKARNVNILPEVDLPGHMVAAITSYPWLSCDSTQAYDDSYKPLGTPKEVRVNSGVSRDVLDVSRPEVRNFLKTVLRHVAEVFPYHYIHIGGDECPTAAWDATPHVKEWMKTVGLSKTDEIQPWLVEELGTWLRDSLNKGVVVWNELVVKGHWKSNYTVKPVVFSYSNNTLNGDNRNVVKQVTEKGFRTIATTTTPMYFDLLQAYPANMELDAPYIGGYGDTWVNTPQTVYNYNPKGTAEDSAALVIGTQGSLWTESCSSGKQAEYQLYPRLLAVSEVGWNPYSSRRNYGNFSARLQEHQSLLKAKNICYAPYAFDAPELTVAESALVSADTLLSQSHPGEVGYPSQEAFDALKNATEALRASQDDAALLTALNSAIAAYKAADVKMPEAGKLYEIRSASTYYKLRLDGSSLYSKGSSLGIHYTEQTEPEEVFSFTAAPNGGFYVKNLMDGKNLVLGAANANASLSTTDSTAILVRKATKSNAKYDYVPGVLNLRNASGVLYVNINNNSGTLVTGTDSTLCWPGSWRICEITDYTHQLAGLVWKCQLALINAKPGTIGQPTLEGVEFLQKQVIDAGGNDVKAGNVSRATYLKYVELYRQFLTMVEKLHLDTPEAGKTYNVVSKADPTLFMSATTAGNNNAKVATTPSKITLVAADNGYYLWADSALYIGMAGNNKWTMAASTAANTVFTLEPADDGYYMVHNTNGYVGYDNPSSDPALYGDKTTANGGDKIFWGFVAVGGTPVNGISSVNADVKPALSGKIFSIDGKFVRNSANGVYGLAKGLYIVDGRKLIVK